MMGGFKWAAAFKIDKRIEEMLLPIFFASSGPVYVDDRVLECVEQGDSVCILSYDYVLKAPKLLERGLVDSARTLLWKAYALVRTREDLPLWRTYTLALYMIFLGNELMWFDAGAMDRADRRAYMDTLLATARGSPLSLYARVIYNSIAVQLNAVPANKYRISIGRGGRDVLFHERMPVAFVGMNTLMDTTPLTYVFMFGWMEWDFVYLNRIRAYLNHPDSTIRALAIKKVAQYYSEHNMPILGFRYISMLDSTAFTLKSPFVRVGLYFTLSYYFNYVNPRRAGSYYARRLYEILDSLHRYAGASGLLWLYGLNEYGYSAPDDSEGLRVLRRALAAHMEHYGLYSDHTANVMANLSVRFVHLGMLDSAAYYIRRLIDIRRRLRGDDFYVFIERIGLVRVYIEAGDSARARAVVREALDRLNLDTQYMPRPGFLYLFRISYAYEILGKRDSALLWMRALVDSAPDNISFRITLARLQVLTGDTAGAAASLDSAFLYVRSGRISSVMGATRGLYGKLLQVWTENIPYFLGAGLDGRVALYSELLKGRSLLEEMDLSEDRVVDSLIRLLNLYADMNMPLDSLIALERRVHEYVERKKLSFISENAPHLLRGTALLGYVVGRRYLLEYLISPRETVVVLKRVQRDSLESMVNRLLSAPGLSKAVSGGLWKILIEPFDTLLRRYRRVAISPHGILTRMPFSILHDGSSYLVEAPYSIYRVFSLWSFSLPCRVRGPALALGRNDYGYNVVLSKRNIGNLRYAEDEARAVVEKVGGVALVGDEVSEEKLYRISLKEYPILHFATHAIVDSSSMIVLGPPGDTAPSRDNLLRVGEIYSRMRVGSLIVLSGCRTGMGRLINDWEGIFNLTRSFIYTGGRCIITTMWDLSDAASYLLMEKMYGYLSDGDPVDMALKRAQLYLLRNTGMDSPLFWGAFVLTVYGR